MTERSLINTNGSITASNDANFLIEQEVTLIELKVTSIETTVYTCEMIIIRYAKLPNTNRVNER